MIVKIKRTFRVIGFRFDAMAAFLMCQHHGVDLNSIDKIPKDEYSVSWVWSAHRSYCIGQYKKPLSYDKMKTFIATMRKSEWDDVLAAMVASSNQGGNDKKKVQHGVNSLSQDGRQD